MKNTKGIVSGYNFSLVLKLCRQHITTVVGDMNEAEGYEYLSNAEFQIAMMRRINEIRAVTDAYTELFNSVEFTNATI